jgi:hypothetical protein
MLRSPSIAQEDREAFGKSLPVATRRGSHSLSQPRAYRSQVRKVICQGNSQFDVVPRLGDQSLVAGAFPFCPLAALVPASRLFFRPAYLSDNCVVKSARFSIASVSRSSEEI